MCFIAENGILESMRKRTKIKVMKYIVAAILILLFVGGISHPVAAADKEIKILLVGNSLTKNRTHEDGNSVQGHLEKMVEAAGKSAVIKTVAFNGGSLKNYAGMNSSKQAQAKVFKRRLKSEDWDYVIIQERTALHYKGHEKKSLPAIEKIIKQIKKQSPNAKILYYVPRGYDHYSAYDGSTKMKEFQMECYMGAAAARIEKRFQIEVIPVNLAFYRCGLLYPNIQLIGEDDKHPNSMGVFLAAACIYQKLFGEPPKVNKEILGHADISAKKAEKFIQLWGEGISTDQVEVILEKQSKHRMEVKFKGKVKKSKLKYTSLNKKIATVDSETGEITAVGSGMTVIVAESKDGWQAYCTVYVPYDAPQGLSAELTKIQSGKQMAVKLTWQKEKDARYEVYRSDSLDGKYKLIGKVRKCKFVDRTATEGKDWYYKVVAVNEYASCAGNMSQAVSVSRVEEKKSNVIR